MNTFDPSRPDFEPYGFTCVRWKPSPMKRADRHNEIELNLLTEGSVTYLMGGHTVEVPAGRLAAFWAGIPHQVIAMEGKSEYFVATIPLTWFLQCKFQGRFVDTVMNGQVVLDPSPRLRGGDFDMFERWVDDLKYEDPQRRRIVFMEMQARLLRFAMALSSETAANETSSQSTTNTKTGILNRVEQMAYFIARHYTEKLTANEICSEVGLHPNYAMSLFKESMGVTLMDFVTQHRVSHAQRLLVTTDMKIIDIALDSGFSSVSRFYDSFSKWCNVSPKDYRVNRGS